MKVPEEWRATTFGDVADLISGQHIPASQYSQEPVGIPYLTGPSDFPDGQITGSSFTQFPRVVCEPKDVLITVKGSGVGKICIADRKYCISRQLAALRARDVDASFLYYAVESMVSELASGATGFIPGISRGQVLDLGMYLPPRSEQIRIAEILSGVDEVIQATQSVIEQTRTVKQCVLKRVLAKGIGHSRFKQTEIGEIPETWKVRAIGELGEVNAGRQRSPHFTEGTLRPYLRVANVFDGFIGEGDLLSMKFTEDEYERYRLKPGDILLNEGQSLELVGRNAVYEGVPADCCFQNTLVRFRSGPEVKVGFAYALMQHLFSSGQFMAIATQTTSVAHLGVKRFANLLVPLPPQDEQSRISAIHSQFVQTLNSQTQKHSELVSLKNALLSDLLTGRKRVTADALSPAV